MVSMSENPATKIGTHIVDRCVALAALTEEPDVMTRTFLTPMHKAANEKVAGWMREAGMTAQQDAIGNMVGRYEGTKPDAPVVMIGSHLDTVRNGGRYDGIMGVITGIAVVEALHKAGRRLPFAVEVVGFGDEEGVRFDATLIGSRAIAGTLPSSILQAKDAEGTTLAKALTEFGLDPKKVNDVVRHRGDLLAYLEVHIEQGPVLERENLPLGVVTAICGATRRRFHFTGEAGHAGTVPMNARKDALVGAAEAVLAAEAVGREHGIVATVGRIAAEPGAINVVPGGASFTLDLRADADTKRAAALADLDTRINQIAKRRSLAMTAETFHDAPASPCAPHLQELFGGAIESLGFKSIKLPSGAGHDGMAMVAIAPIGMLFVRCAKGISHNPAEAVIADDVGLGALALSAALEKLAGKAG
jgi:hydantoinase/carbamoylase family amidase